MRPAFLGVAVDERQNAGTRGDIQISSPGATPAVLVVESREDSEIARQTRLVLETVAD